MPNTPIRYIVEVNNVAEVMLIGSADLTFWQERLKPEGLRLYNSAGCAEVLISATQLKWKGVTSRELTVSIGVADRADETRRGGAYLAQAFNSLALFAWSERTFFKTPYFPGEIQVEVNRPAIELRLKHTTVFAARQSSLASSVQTSDELWTGPIYLPRYLVGAHDPGRVFYAKLGGRTHSVPFAADDTLTMQPTVLVFKWLIDSNFTAHEWRLRPKAAHAKSKTYRRAE
ncbi:MAG TPA: hypothetical protein VLG46_07055 [Anaerolineae bacterium]|nr:hypothetical protein [Anaerolineae bacterium]